MKRKRAEATNLWNEPVDATHMERDDDRELYNLLQKRAKLRRGSEVGAPTAICLGLSPRLWDLPVSPVGDHSFSACVLGTGPGQDFGVLFLGDMAWCKSLLGFPPPQPAGYELRAGACPHSVCSFQHSGALRLYLAL